MPLQASPLFLCPQCRTPVRGLDTTCRACGINLALAAVLAERLTLAQAPVSAAVAAPELPRFGEFLISQGLITPAQLHAGLDQQRQAAAQGQARTIGQTLVAMGALTREQLELASIQQVQQLQAALEASNRQLEQRVAERTQALQAALQRLAELDEFKANFVANISHELRTPLVPIRGFSELLAAGRLGALNPRQQEAADTIAQASQRLEALINTLIQLASSVKGEMVINATRVAVAGLARPLRDYFAPRAAAHGIHLHCDLPEHLPPALADAEKIYWVLFQLLDNALKHTPAGGAVTLSAEASPPRLRLAVSDTGVGIAPERLGRLFEPFQSAPGAPGLVVEGAGLGLALVKRIVEAHDSRVEVHSQPQQGSRFAFELPLADTA